MKAPPWLSRELASDCVLALVMTAIGVSSVFTTDDSVAYDYPPADARLVLMAMGDGCALVRFGKPGAAAHVPAAAPSMF